MIVYHKYPINKILNKIKISILRAIQKYIYNSLRLYHVQLKALLTLSEALM